MRTKTQSQEVNNVAPQATQQLTVVELRDIARSANAAIREQQRDKSFARGVSHGHALRAKADVGLHHSMRCTGNAAYYTGGLLSGFFDGE